MISRLVQRIKDGSAFFLFPKGIEERARTDNEEMEKELTVLIDGLKLGISNLDSQRQENRAKLMNMEMEVEQLKNMTSQLPNFSETNISPREILGKNFHENMESIINSSNQATTEKAALELEPSESLQGQEPNLEEKFRQQWEERMKSNEEDWKEMRKNE